MSADPHMVAGRYRLDERIGSGGMGVVWRAHDMVLNRTVAVKQLLLGPGLSPSDADESRARAMREGRIAARLQHPHAINVFDVALGPDLEGSQDSQPWLVMEYLPSRSLADVLTERGPLPPLEVARIGRQIADALAAAHRAGIVHRDVKPGNVLIGENGTVKITDFGIARASWDTTVTRTGVLTGTPAYFAPEVARGEAPGPASDVFSMGSTLYNAVEGMPPFGHDDNTLALLRSVADGKVRPPHKAGLLTALLMQLLREEPAQRPVMTVARDMLGRIVIMGREPATASLPTTADGRPSEVTAGPVPRVSPVLGAAGPDEAAEPDEAAGMDEEAGPDEAAGMDEEAGQEGDGRSAGGSWLAPVAAVGQDALPAEPSTAGSAPVTATPQDAPPVQTPRPAPSARPAPRVRRPTRPARPARTRTGTAWWKRGKVLAGASLLLLITIAAVTLALTLGGPDDSSTAAPAPTSATTPVVTTTPAPTTTTAAPTTPAPTTPQPPPAAPAPPDFVTAVQTYYGLLPDRLDEAYAYLGPGVQEQAGGRGGYENFWNDYSEVESENVQADGTTVTLTIVYTELDGTVFREPYVLEMGTADDGRILILSSEIV